MDTDRREKGRKKDKVVFPIDWGEATNTEKMKALFESVQSWGTKEEYRIIFHPGR